jgi:hypothetical protein
MPRIRLAAMAAALTLVGSAPTALAQQAQRPQIETTKVEGTDNVYIFRNGNHQSMFIVTKDGVIATDPIAYGRPTGGQDYIAEIKKVTDRPIKFLIYSHHHYDHIAGGKPFKDAGATIIAHRRAKERLAMLNDPNTPLPDQVVNDNGRTIKLGGTTLELKYLGLNHSDSNLVMRLPLSTARGYYRNCGAAGCSVGCFCSGFVADSVGRIVRERNASISYRLKGQSDGDPSAPASGGPAEPVVGSLSGDSVRPAAGVFFLPAAAVVSLGSV